MNFQSRDPVNHLLSIRKEGMVAFNSDGHITSVSPLFLAWTGADDTGDGLVGLNEAQFSDWLAHRSPSGAPFSGVAQMRKRARLDAGRTEVIEIKIGGAPPTLLALSWFDDDQQSTSGVLIVRDVSVDSGTELAKQKFLAKAAHDLRSPLASIAGFAEVLHTDTLDAQTQAEFLSIMVDQAALLTQMMSEVFDLARMDAQKGKDYRFVRISLQALVSDVVANLALPSGHTCPVLRMPVAPVWLMADLSKLKQAFRHVLANAYQFSPDGGTVKLEVSVMGRPNAPDRACLLISDTGIGMTPEQTSRVFDRYFSASTATTTAGRGLGMAMVKKIVERHHGDLSVASVAGQGTQVEINLPLARLAS